MNRKISKLLVANRAEIALRIKRAADGLGITSACVASEADRHQSYLKAFKDEVYILSEAATSSAKDTYLKIPLIIRAARALRCDAIHPGYGFLSENAGFVEAVEAVGLVF